MQESDLPVQYRPRSKRPWWRSRLFLGAVLIVLLLVGGFVGVFLYQSHAAKRELRHAIAELDEKEPDGWRLHEIEARRAVVPDEQNSAFIVLAVQKRLPKFWPPLSVSLPSNGVGAEEVGPLPPPSFDKRISQLPLDLQLDESLTRELREELEKVFPALAAAQRLADLPAGRFPIDWSIVWPSVPLHSEHALTVANLLRFEAALWAQDRQPDRAIRSTRGTLNCARSIGDEPTLLSMLVRVAIQETALRSLERALAQGEPSNAELVDFQRLLEDEAAQPLFYNALRGERAGLHEALNDLARGKVTVSQLSGAIGGPPSFLDDVEESMMVAAAPRANARLLRAMTWRIEIAQKPLEEQAELLAPKPRPSGRYPDDKLVRLLLPTINRVAEASWRSQAKLRCGVTALAIERYRLSQGRWPEALDEVVRAELLNAIPVDPYGTRIRLRCAVDGVVIYSVGIDDRLPATDLSFHLWDVDRRRGPAHEWIPAPREAPFPDDPP